MLSMYLVVGAFAGVMSGLFGIGGGVIVIPALAAIFLHYAAIPQNAEMQMAVGTSLAIMIVTSLSALYAHYKREAVRWDIFFRMLPGLAIGAIIGAFIAHFLSSNILKIIFSGFLFIIGVRMALNRETHEGKKPVSSLVTQIAALLIGVLSSLLGIGGGVLLVPFLLYSQMDIRAATGTSIACGLSVGIVATICFMIAGLFTLIPVEWSTGYIYWPAFLGISVASALFAPLGAMLAHKLPKEFLKRIFGWFLLVMACDMLFSLIRN